MECSLGKEQEGAQLKCDVQKGHFIQGNLEFGNL